MLAFWDDFLEPFLQDIAWRSFDQAREFCEKRSLRLAPVMVETSGLLKLGLCRALNRMVDIDRRLRGGGFPKTVEPRNPEFLRTRLERIIDNRLAAELAA